MSDDLRRAAERFVPGANSNAVNELRDAALVAADRIAALEAEVRATEAVTADRELLRRVLRLCAHDNEFDVTIESMTIWPDFFGYAALRRLLGEDET